MNNSKESAPPTLNLRIRDPKGDYKIYRSLGIGSGTVFRSPFCESLKRGAISPISRNKSAVPAKGKEGRKTRFAPLLSGIAIELRRIIAERCGGGYKDPRLIVALPLIPRAMPSRSSFLYGNAPY